MAIEGNLQDMSLPTLVQSIVQEGRQVRVELRASNRIGFLYIDQGRLWDASVLDISNKNLELFSAEEAVYELLKWKEGQFILERDITPSRQTIKYSWNHVLMEGLRKVDEQRDFKPPHPEETLDEMLLDLNEDDAATLRELAALHVHKEKIIMASKSEQLRDVLNNVISNSGDLIGAVVVDNDGLLLASNLSSGTDGNRVAAVSAGLVSLAGRSAKQLGQGEISQTIIRAANGNIIAMRVGTRAVFVALTPSNVNLGMAFMECNDAVDTLQDVL